MGTLPPCPLARATRGRCEPGGETRRENHPGAAGRTVLTEPSRPGSSSKEEGPHQRGPRRVVPRGPQGSRPSTPLPAPAWRSRPSCPPISALFPRRSTCPPSNTRSSTAGGTARSSSAPSSRTRAVPTWVFYEGPPTANGMPGVHHVEARVFKDLFPRYKSMQGYNVPRKAGWDCHGLPVEVAVEKELGLTGKQDIEAYGVAEFNARCRESVLRHVDAFEEMTERMGYWIDLSQAYRTMDPAYIESVWWSLKVIFDKGLLVPRLPDHAVLPPLRHRPVRPRAGPAGRLRDGHQPVGLRPHARHLGPAGRARRLPADLDHHPVDAGLQHRRRRAPRRDLRRGAPRRVRRGAGGGRAAAGLGAGRGAPRCWPPSRARELERTTYSPSLRPGRHPRRALRGARLLRHHRGRHRPGPPGARLRRRRPDDLQAVRPARGQPDRPRRALPRRRPPGRRRSSSRTPTRRLTADLRGRGLLYRGGHFEHSYPHCWRCHTALLYYALPAWYIRTTAIKDQLLAENEKTNWYPETIKWGRFGEWLRNNVDWSLSRSRYWGTPLPLWVCSADESHVTCVGSLAELGQLSGQDVSALDPHRPYVDDVTLPCPTCGAEARRVPDVIDAWYDSGSMPFAQWGAPHQNAEMLEEAYPGAVHLRGHRPDARLVLLADGGRHAGLRASRRTRTCSASG